MRIGHGFDVHKFGGGKPLVIGGVVIPFSQGLLAYSDGDVLLHAVINSFLGAAACGDIGMIFPNTDEKFKGASSRDLLRIVWKKILNKGYQLSNLDITVIIQMPQLSSYIFQIRKNIVEDLNCQIDMISVKSVTTEKLGFIGRNEGIACESLVLLI
ncbi:2-C-methyl-D-erythritol 2,4-cyclodiphosphate synthase [Blochmannia endosymbiont of Camponotus (Colobopsis) obliquus]|uniref:2-C-methyl-D-erythritol 2,4-cyclodiphosphate synthase n=1 Tax=Blochmannia endosymbiont of Camponotus (Colobopsis) obliquus TaxID=1505597 RepID=UPI00061A6826|nr:2-C-methyl-D-erythritol 2,4-cyclodiphosphate synthase [Blochmannia endosymbiont of Camponotus (Colobopsis) obliquus]AKC60342.1 2-C-methyl-D-erythritol 2,4-cyclodiphosphate synthase [Blochmannia endosymbiont of Camponotus (Colobopsis) obliquus]